MFQCFILPLCPCPIKQKKKTYLPVTEHSKRIRVPTGLLAQVSSLITLFFVVSSRALHPDPGSRAVSGICGEVVLRSHGEFLCSVLVWRLLREWQQVWYWEELQRSLCQGLTRTCLQSHTHMKCLEKILIQIDVRFTRKFTSVSEYSCSYFDTDR